jgi:hypothetical protein
MTELLICITSGTRITPLTTRHIALRVRVSGRFAASSPSFPISSSGR